MATLLTKEICTPRDLCCPEQSRQIKDPKDKDAQVGFGAEQSQQALLPGSWRMEAAEARGIWLLIFGEGGGGGGGVVGRIKRLGGEVLDCLDA